MAVKKKRLDNATDVPNKEELLKLYRDMVLIRRFEEKAGQLYGMGLIRGYHHLYIGQEAVVTGLQSMQEPQDTVVTTYRDHGHMLACDMDPNGIMAELTGREGGFSRGKGGSMHMFSKEKKFYGGHGIVGASAAIGTGLAFTHKYKKDNGVAVTYMGDGSANQGQFFECMNMAALWKLPVLYIIENNGYSMGTAIKRHAAGEFYKRGECFGIPGEQVNGQDVLEVRKAARQALDYIRSGNGPYLLEIKTYRYKGHSTSDPQKYRSKEEVQDYKDNNDPILNLKAIMDAEGIKEDELKSIDKDIKAIVKEAEEFAKTSPIPDAAELWTDVLVEVKN